MCLGIISLLDQTYFSHHFVSAQSVARLLSVKEPSRSMKVITASSLIGLAIATVNVATSGTGILTRDGLLTAPSANISTAGHFRGDFNNGACMFKNYKPSAPYRIYGAAISDKSWYAAGYCGACVDMRGPIGTTIRTMVVDKCNKCPTFFNVFDDGYKELARFGDERIQVEWQIVSCDFQRPITVVNKEASNKWWWSVQIQDANYPVFNLRVSKAGQNNWIQAVAKDWNYFEQPGKDSLGDKVDLWIECSNGNAVMLLDVSTAGNHRTVARTNC